MARAPSAAATMALADIQATASFATVDPPFLYDPADHYWIVADDEKTRWSSAARAYVPADDARYLAFIKAGGVATRIRDEAELWEVLRAAAPERLPEDQKPTRYVRKLLILDRLVAAKLFDAAMAALGGPGQLAYERWQAATEIAADDPQVRGLLGAIGADPDAILAPE